jgi:hypothetical protein
MANERTPDHRDGPAEPPFDVQITVVPRRDGPAPWERVRDQRIMRPARTLVAVALLAAIVTLAALAIGVRPRHRPGAPTGVDAAARLDRAEGVAATYGYGYPFRCLSITIDAHHPTFARAVFHHGGPCAPYNGYLTAVFHRTGGAWRVVQDAGAYWCPAGSIPRAVQAELGICGWTGRAAARRN